MNSLTEVLFLITRIGKNKIKYPIIKMLILSILGGIFVGLSAGISLICGYNLVEGKIQLYKSMIFPIGIILVYCAGGELITEDMLYIIPFFSGKIGILNLLLSWLIVLVGNLIGCILISVLIIYSHIPNMFNVSLAQIIIVTGNEKCGLNFGETFLQALLGNFLICSGSMISMIGKDMRSVFFGLFIPNFLLSVLGLAHCVADMYYIISGLFLSYEYGLDSVEMNWGKLFYKIIIPEFLGGITGGAVLIGAMYWYIFLTNDEIKSNNQINNNNIKNNVENDQLNDQIQELSSIKMKMKKN